MMLQEFMAPHWAGLDSSGAAHYSVEVVCEHDSGFADHLSTRKKDVAPEI
jgi:hypothetical protein